MRTFPFFVWALLVAASPASAATRNFGISSFTKIRVEGPYKVNLTTGVPPFVKASGSTMALDRLAIEIRDDTLIIQTDPSAWGGYPGEDPGPIEVSVGTHNLSKAALTGAGSLAINAVRGLTFAISVQGSGAAQIDDVDADQMEVSLVGTASARLSGHAKQLTSLVRGVSMLNAAKLSAADAHITADGSATVEANITNSARIDAWGPATIRLSGKPACTLKVTGSTSVSGCR